MKWNKNKRQEGRGGRRGNELTNANAHRVHTTVYLMGQFSPCLSSNKAWEFCGNTGHLPGSGNYHFNYGYGVPPSPGFLLKPHTHVSPRSWGGSEGGDK